MTLVIRDAIESNDLDRLAISVCRELHHEYGDKSYCYILNLLDGTFDSLYREGYWWILENLGYYSDGVPHSVLITVTDSYLPSSESVFDRRSLCNMCLRWVPQTRGDLVLDEIKKLAEHVLSEDELSSQAEIRMSAVDALKTISNRSDAVFSIQKGSSVIPLDLINQCLSSPPDLARDFSSAGFTHNDIDLLCIRIAMSWYSELKSMIAFPLFGVCLESRIDCVVPSTYIHRLVKVIWEDRGSSRIARDVILDDV